MSSLNTLNNLLNETIVQFTYKEETWIHSYGIKLTCPRERRWKEDIKWLKRRREQGEPVLGAEVWADEASIREQA